MVKKKEEKQSFITSKQYEEMRDNLIKKIQIFLEGKNVNYKVRYTCAIMAIIITSLLNKESVIANDEVIEEENMEIEQDEIVEFCQKSQEINADNLIEETDALVETNNQIVEDNCIQNLYDAYIEEYSNYYHLNSEKVIELAKMTTNNYNDFTNIIGNNDFDYTNPEACCMLFVYYLNCNELTTDLEELGLSKNDLVITKKIETLSYEHIDDLRVEKNLTYTEFVGKVCDFFHIKDKRMVIAVSFSEMDIDNPKDASRRYNNFSGMMTKDFELMKFPTPEAGIISMCGNYKKNFNDYDLNNIEEFACYHVAGRKTMPNYRKEPKLYKEIMGWASNVTDKYYMICENYEGYFTPNDYECAMNLNLTK